MNVRDPEREKECMMIQKPTAIRQLGLLLATLCIGFGSNAQITAKKATVYPSEAVRVLANALEPAKITRHSGPFVLYVENRTGIVSETYRLDAEPSAGGAASRTTTPLATWATQKFKWWDHTLLNLQPGTYRFSLGSRADLTLQLVITN